MRLLIAEDNVRLGSYIRAALNERGFNADHVETAGDAAAALAGIDYEALILDLGLRMPMACPAKKKMRRNNDMRPVLILTARDSTRCLSAD